MKPIKQAVILAGGEGIRLRPLTNDRPKPMVLVNGRPFIDYLIDLLKENGIEEIVLLLGYLPEKITEHLGDGSKFGIKVKYSIGEVEDYTGTRVRNAKNLLSERFLLLYCDNYLPLDLKKLVDFHNSGNTPATMTVYQDKITGGGGRNNVFVDESGYVMKYGKKGEDPSFNGNDMGFFILHREIVDSMPRENFWFEHVTIPQLISQHLLRGFVVHHSYYSLGDPERLKITEKFLIPKKVVLLDRDGVINKKAKESDYVKNWGEFEFLPGAIEAMKLLVNGGYDIYIISNQAGIARGKMTEDDLRDIHSKMERELANHGVKIAGIYYCPHGWNDGCFCRKPKPGMLFQAARDHYLDLSKTIFIGDDARDVEAGQAAGCKTILLEKGGSLLEVVRSILDT